MSLLSLHFRLFHDRFHLFVCHDLIVCPKAKGLVQRVREVCSCITGNIARAFDLLEVHPPELADDVFTGEVAFQSLLILLPNINSSIIHKEVI